MAIQKQHGSATIITIVVVVSVVIGLVMVNRWLAKETSRIASDPVEEFKAPESAVSSKKETARPKVLRKGEVTRKSRMAPGRNYIFNIFYQEGEEIARDKTTLTGEVYEQTGEIPDGKVKFVNTSDGTYGIEFYRNQKLDGPAQLYYVDDVLNKDFYYQSGKLLTVKEYFHNGSIRMQNDYADARENSDTKEAGMGKVFFPNGQIKYEWKFTVTDSVGYRKSYDRQGRLVDAIYYDEYGQVTDATSATFTSSASSKTSNQAPISKDVSPEKNDTVYGMPKQIFVPME